ncbi:FAD-linked oxidase C-terminal domain-containing protein [Parachitinimonas caeni]|uniref:FAD-linked oxidase C-terminal domain-containing protein n=1 Tax=Parachitinimonas caeni TaxID=3031301 RepID=A0ABT7E3Z6_9NEIS|nr:FAD-linked oxidase C-terminal domain-containing protein [Parachitinimonas caeni]MDK2126130.1 FAD-linked oxidase C-terminal domain-containing protein [Parachitinimonas caeni]
MPNSQFLSDLAATVDAQGLLTSAEQLRVYECDGLAAYRQLPLAVVLPTTEQQVIAVLRCCHRHQVAVVARGSGTGLSGGALPVEGGIVLSLTRMNAILNINPLGRSARVQPGVRNAAISEAAASHGLYYAPDPSSQIACSIGGNVAENAGGVHCLKYGLTVNNLLAVRAITSEGELLIAGGEAPDQPGLDLLMALTGSEGLLAVITEITVRLLPKPQVAQVILAAFPTVGAAGTAVANLIGQGIIPAGLELMDQATTRAVESFVQAGYPTDAAAILLCEADGTAEEVRADIEAMSQVLREAGATALRVSCSEAERLTFWAGRKAAFPAAAKLAPDYYCMDGTIPRHRLAEVLDGIAGLAAEHGLACINVFHAGDGNLHPLILFDANEGDQLHRAEALGARILELCVAVGGAITGEHGVGLEKINQMCVQFGEAELRQFQALKAAFDPALLLNPGKAIPSLHRCAEYGRMHVHQGQLPFSNLPRF